MINRVSRYVIIIPIALITYTLGAQDAYTTYLKMMDAIESSKTLQFNLDFQERIKGEMVNNKVKAKVNQTPFKVYMYQLLPHEGVEVIYNASLNTSEAYINPNSFPWFTMTFGIHSNALRENYRSSIFNVGYSAIAKLDSFLQKKYNSSYSSMIKFEPDTKCSDGSPCIAISINITDFRYFKYTMKANENLITLSARNSIGEYMILELNPDIKDYFDISPGETILIPSDYAKKITLLIDAKTFLPREIKFYDDKELFQEYRYSNIIKNPSFNVNEFSLENPDYNF